jgi:hypothetical protein
VSVSDLREVQIEELLGRDEYENPFALDSATRVSDRGDYQIRQQEPLAGQRDKKNQRVNNGESSWDAWNSNDHQDGRENNAHGRA